MSGIPVLFPSGHPVVRNAAGAGHRLSPRRSLPSGSRVPGRAAASSRSPGPWHILAYFKMTRTVPVSATTDRLRSLEHSERKETASLGPTPCHDLLSTDKPCHLTDGPTVQTVTCPAGARARRPGPETVIHGPSSGHPIAPVSHSRSLIELRRSDSVSRGDGHCQRFESRPTRPGTRDRHGTVTPRLGPGPISSSFRSDSLPSAAEY
eukprot:441506-Hanusia_phi.AAC.2